MFIIYEIESMKYLKISPCGHVGFTSIQHHAFICGTLENAEDWAEKSLTLKQYMGASNRRNAAAGSGRLTDA